MHDPVIYPQIDFDVKFRYSDSRPVRRRFLHNLSPMGFDRQKLAIFSYSQPMSITQLAGLTVAAGA